MPFRKYADNNNTNLYPGNRKIVMRKLNVITCLIALTAWACIESSPLQAQQKRKAGGGSSSDVTTIQNGSDTIDMPEEARLLLAVYGGYLLPLGDSGDMMKGSWAVKMFVRKNNISSTLFGIGLDAVYSSPEDKKYDGSFITYGILMPNVTGTFHIVKDVYAGFKVGAGFTTLVSKLAGSYEASLSFTMNGGITSYGIIDEHAFAGVEVDYYYLFQIHSTTAVTCGLYAGYRF